MRAGRELELPASLETTFSLIGRFPVTESEWSRLIFLLEAMRPGLVETDEARARRDELEQEDPF